MHTSCFDVLLDAGDRIFGTGGMHFGGVFEVVVVTVRKRRCGRARSGARSRHGQLQHQRRAAARVKILITRDMG